MKREKNIIGTIVLILGIFTLAVFGQNSDNKNGADRTLQSSGRVNPSTLGMEIDIPLGAYPGRGINVPIGLSYSSKVWRMESLGKQPIAGGNYSSCYANYRAVFAEETASGWTTSLAVPYIEYTGMNNPYQYNGSPVSYDDVDCPTSGGGNESYPYFLIRRLVVHLPSGETHELRIDDTAYEFRTGEMPEDSFWDGTYLAADGSNIKYVRDSGSNVYRLLMPDGSFYDFSATIGGGAKRNATKFTDRNGNFTTYYAPGSTDDQNIFHPNGYWKDTLGRNISIPLKPTAPTTPTTSSNPQVYAMPGMTGTYKMQWKNLKGSSAAESGLTNFSLSLKPVGDAYLCYTSQGFPTTCVRPVGYALFSGGGNAAGPRVVDETIFNPIVLTEIELPTGQKYKFSYDIYGRIEKIIYPTGGEEVFQFAEVPTLSQLEYDDLTGQANFGVTDRKVYPTSGQSANYHWTYAAQHVAPQGYQVTINNPDGTKVERLTHRGTDAGTSLEGTFGYDNGLAGMAYEERAYNSANSLVSKKLTTWTKTALTTSGASVKETHWHPRVTQEESTIFEAGNGISATMKYFYEGNLNLRETPLLQNKTEQYEFVVAGNSPPSTPIRTSETTYSTNSVYLAQNMVGLATSSQIKDAAGTVVSRSEMVYDEAGYSPNLGRGNPTSARVWDSTKGLVTNPAAYIQTRARFDGYGNQYESIDAKGNATTTTFDATYHAYPIQVTSAIPDPTNQHGSNTAFVSSTTFNPITGLPLTTTDANGLETRIEYDAVTLRPLNTKTFYNNVQVGTTAETIYHDEPNNYWVKNRSQIDATNWAESISYFDGLGRAYKAEEVNSQGNIFVEKEFDGDGRVLRVSNPYRTGETKYWTTNVYDESSRVKQVTLPGGATVKTDFGVSTSGIIGVTKQITDQAGKRRKGFSDALGRMVRVIEDPTSTENPNGQNLSTDYVFDTLGNLRKTIQGEQSRYFTHDSLGRLLYAKQPEQAANVGFNFTDSITGNSQWSVKYEYDDNGNITTTTDAKGTSVTGTYDNFNRLKKRVYSDTTPEVWFYYDGRGLGAVPARSNGKTTKITSSVSETRYTAFNELGQLTAHQQITDGNTYTTGYTYDSFGRMISETYPSTRTVKVDYNKDGDVSSVWGTVGTQNRLYANGFSYNSAGAMERMRLGNGKWETYAYNERQQITEIALGNSATDKSLLKLEYGYGSNTQNNGNLLSQKITFNGLTQPFEQTYSYDSLNRLQSAEEKVNNSPTWKQTFEYDRYGNRRFDANNTTTLGSCSQAVCNPLINTSDNRFSSGQNYAYDANGNVTQDATGKQFLYDAENHQTTVKDAANNPIGEYLYDGEGKRVKKISSTEITVFVYNGGGTLVAEYSTAIAQTPQVSYLTADHLGSARVITDQTGKVTTRKDYMAFGDEATSAQRSTNLNYDSSETRKGYTGYEKDTESGLEFAQARYYNATHGRFTSVDPLTASASIKNPQTFNRYSYVLNSPYKFVDPLGLISVTTGACGGSCPNSGGSVDGSSFRGTDTSMIGNMIASMNLSINVSNAIRIVQSADFSQNRLGSGFSAANKAAMVTALTRILSFGNSAAQQLIVDMVFGGVTFDGTTSITAQSNVVGTPENVNDATAAIAAGKMTYEKAIGFMQILIPIGEFTNSTSVEAAVEGSIIHEAMHVKIRALSLASLSTGDPRKYENDTTENDERRCKLAVATYKIHMAKKMQNNDYILHGQHPKVAELDSKGGINNQSINSMAKNSNFDNSLNSFIKLGITWKKMKASY